MITIAARPTPLDLDVARTAVVVVDMQNSFVSRGGMFDLAGLDIAAAPAVIAANRRLLDAARRAGVRVVYLRMGYQPDLSDGGGPESPNYHKELARVMMRQRPELDGTLLIRGTWDWQIVDELTPQPGDWVVDKTRYSGFCGTGLADRLRAAGIRTLLFTGVATNVCVESTARAAYFDEFWPVLVEDAVNHAGPDFTRQATLWNFETLFGWVSDSAALVAALEAAPKAAHKAAE